MKIICTKDEQEYLCKKLCGDFISECWRHFPPLDYQSGGRRCIDGGFQNIQWEVDDGRK